MDFVTKKEKGFYNTLFKIALPIAIQNLISSSLNMLDTIMIGQLGESHIAAVGAANQVFFLLTLLLFGICSGSSIFTAQYWGKKDIVNIKRVLGICILFGGAIAFLFSIGALFMPIKIISIFSPDPNVIFLGSKYLKIISLSYVITAIVFAYSFVLRSIEKPNLPTCISAIALGINGILNYIFIFGHLGAPKMGVEGAALATLFSRVMEFVLLIGIIYYKKYPIAAKIKEMKHISFSFIKRYLKVTYPVVINEFTWALGVSVYAIVYGRMGTDVLAASNIAGTVEKIAMVIFFGIGNACAVMLGNQIGANNEEKAFAYAKRFIIITLGLAIFIGIGIFLGSEYILSFYKISPLVYEYSYKILIVFSIFFIFKMFNLITIVGIFRSGGDTKFAMFLDLGGVWLIGVPLAYIGGIRLGLPIYWVYSLVYIEEVIKLFFGLYRMISKKWLNSVIQHFH